MTIALAKANFPYQPFAENFADKTPAAPPAQPAWGDARVFGRAGSATGAPVKNPLRDMALMEKKPALASARGVQVAAEGGGIDFGGPEEAALLGAGLLALTLIGAFAAAGGVSGVAALGSGLAKGWTLYLGGGLGILGLTSGFGDILTIPSDVVTTLVGYLLGQETPTNLSEVPQLLLESGERIDLMQLLENQNAPQEAQRMLSFFSNHKISGIPGMSDLTSSQYYEVLRRNGLSREDAMNGTYQAMAYSYNEHIAKKDHLWKHIPNPLKFFGEKLHEIFSRKKKEPVTGEEDGRFLTNPIIPLDLPNRYGLTVGKIREDFMRSGMAPREAHDAAEMYWTNLQLGGNNRVRPDYYGEPPNNPSWQNFYNERAVDTPRTDPGVPYPDYGNNGYYNDTQNVEPPNNPDQQNPDNKGNPRDSYRTYMDTYYGGHEDAQNVEPPNNSDQQNDYNGADGDNRPDTGNYPGWYPDTEANSSQRSAHY